MQQRRRAAVHPQGRQGLTVPDEPLALSAPLARRLAPRLCRKDPATGESCAWYHGFWQYARLLDLGSPPSHERFLLDAFSRLTLQPGALSVLISGAADYYMLALVLRAFAGREPQVTVLDQCETPLTLNRWYGERMHCEVQTRQREILQCPEDRAYDLICTHAFISYFSPAQRGPLIEKWGRLLRPGGYLVTMNRLRPGSADRRVGFSASEVAAYGASVLERAATLHGALPCDPQDLARAAEDYARRTLVWPLRSGHEIAELVARAGLDLVHFADGPLVGEGPRTGPVGPTAPGTADYLQLIARRR